ncbi:MAG: carbohydrate-binding module family 20 domain-containing protein, partial [Myxococcaceae bacterium]
DRLVTLVDNHDLPRVMSQCGGDVERVRQALVFQLTSRGTPSLLYGTEAGLSGAKEPENRGDMKFDSPVLRGAISSVLELRRLHPSLVEGVPMALEVEPGLFVYARVTAGEVAVIAVNRRRQPVTLRLPEELKAGASWRDAAAAPLDPGSITLGPGAVLVALGVPAPGEGFGALHRRALEQRAGTHKRQVDFELAGAPVQDGAEVFIVGSSPEAGAWKPEQGLGPLDAGGRLRAELPVGTVLDFKFVLRSKDGKPRWEDGENRTLFVREGEGPQPVTGTWGAHPK